MEGNSYEREGNTCMSVTAPGKEMPTYPKVVMCLNGMQHACDAA